MKTTKQLKESWKQLANIVEECELMREVVQWMDSRNENLNQGKTIARLTNEYLNEVLNLKH